jgi:hypothetical protein
MNVDEYVAARYGRLLEHAVELGAEEGLAAEYVDQVLLDQRKAIKKADDPDPLVRAALERAVLKLPEPGLSPWPFVAVGLVAIAVVVGVVLTQDPETRPVPSLFGYTGDQARTLLEDEGYDVVLRPVRQCDPLDQVLGSEPAAGAPVEDGARISVFTAAPAGSDCEAVFGMRSDAWDFLAFAITGNARTEFARTVTVVVDGVEGEPRSGTASPTSERWRTLRGLIAREATRPAGNATGLPFLIVTQQTPPDVTCGTERPVSAGDRVVLRLEIDGRQFGATTGCPLTIDLYRTSRAVIDAVVIYSSVPEA